MFDLTQSNHEYDDYEKEDKLCTREAIAFILNYWGIPSEDYNNPLFSPYYEKTFKNFPKTTFIVGEYDGLRNDTEAYFKKLKAISNQVEKIVLPGQTHNTMVMRGVMTDGEDPAYIVAKIILKENLTNCKFR